LTWFLKLIEFVVHNDFHVTHGIFPLFDGFQVQDMEKPLHATGVTNGDSENATTTNGDSTANGDKSILATAVDAAKSATSAITNGLNGLKVAN
jgi:methylenetetrahydrofolate reductase (NADPH)